MVGAVLEQGLGLGELAVVAVERGDALHVAQVAGALAEDRDVEREPRQRERGEDERQHAEEPADGRAACGRTGGGGGVVRVHWRGILPEARRKVTHRANLTPGGVSVYFCARVAHAARRIWKTEP